MTDLFEVEEDHFLLGNTGVYQLEKFLGEGAFGKVAQCKKLGTNELFAIKIIKNKYKLVGEHELKVLQEIRQLDANEHSIVSFMDDFSYKNHTCMVFEMLEQSLFQFIKNRTTRYLELDEIRIVAKQLLAALDGLKSINMVHCDIKMDNIMLVNHKSEPFRLKLIDFGLAKKANELKTGTKIQNLTYRAPEVILGLPLDERLDLWTVGYILSYLYTGFLLHPKDCEYNVIRAMVAMQGMPDGFLLDRGIFSMTASLETPPSPPRGAGGSG
uniref:Protein kinase domain-containing protein n=1 Tax=Oryzias melastigma TaxID=30732 RepID=A0A3B3CT05_ORYME